MHIFDHWGYEINRHTMALLPSESRDHKTKVIDAVLGEIYVKETTMELIKKACLEGGASFEGRRKYTEYELGISQKVPLVVNPLENIYIFPTVSSRHPDCIWLFANHIHGARSNGKTATITFSTGYILEVDISFLILERQIQRAALLYQRITLKHH